MTDLLQVSGAFIRPAFGGPTLPESPAEALLAGRFHRMPLMLGTTSDEARFFVGLFADLAGNSVTAESYPRLLAEAFGDASDEVAGPTRRPPPDTEPRLGADLHGPSLGATAWELGRAFAAHTGTWFYEFADRDAPPIVPVPGFPTGA